MNIELYIGDRLCDIGNPENLGIYLKRVFIKPSELSMKDAQKSYEISLPATPSNNEIFNYANVEEVQGKFKVYDNARLYIDGVLILDGKFRMSQITKDAYNGNLGVPAPKTVKDIFGETKLTENAPLKITFNDFAGSINYWNEEAKDGNLPPCIFPYTLYGLLPKVASSLDGNTYSDRDLWDDTVRVGIEDLPPSINVLNMLKHIFHKKGYTLTGTALNDARLNSLYMSYKNETDYVQPWNYGRQAYIKLSGNWSNIDWNKADNAANKYEKGCYTSNSDGVYYTCDLFNSTRSKITINQDTGTNVLLSETKDSEGFFWRKSRVTIPMSGFYKIRLKGNINIDSRENWRYDRNSSGIQFVGGNASDDSDANSFRKKRYELKLLRDFGAADFGLSSARINRRYYLNNLNQNDNWNKENAPKYIPKIVTTTSGKQCDTIFIDPAENPNCIVGLCWGQNLNNSSRHPDISSEDRTDRATVIAAKTGFSWDVRVNGTKPSKVAIHNPEGYRRWGVIEDFANAEDKYINRFENATIKTNVFLDETGLLQPITNPFSEKTAVISRYELLANRTYILGIPDTSLWLGSIYIYDSADLTKPCVEELKANDFWTGTGYEFQIETTDKKRYISFPQLHEVSGQVKFNISNVTRLHCLDPNGEDIIGWEFSRKYRIILDNSPENYASRGWYKGNYKNNDWYGEGEVNAIVWLEHGELLTLAVSSDEGRYKRHNSSGKYGWTNQNVDFELDISPFRINEDWIKINTSGNGTAAMNWNDSINFQSDYIDLVKFLPNDVRTDEFIDNFCKAFNLRLSQTGITEFSLDVKQVKRTQQNTVVDIDTVASVKDTTNMSLELPSAFSVGFTVNTEEEGFVESNGDDGGGMFYTGSPDDGTIEQKSNFSYNWFKDIRKAESESEVVNIPLPVISKAEVWTSEITYPEAMSKEYMNLPQRFWYFDGLLNDLGVSFNIGSQGNEKALKLAKVTNTLPELNTLSYKNENDTILTNYFSLLTDANSNYTLVECYLTPDQYNKIGDGANVRLNGDLYYVAEIDGYDPLNKKKCKLKLIRKMI